MSALKIKDTNGQWINIPTLKGEKGDIYNLLDSVTLSKTGTSSTVNGITYQWIADGRCKITGTATANTDYVVYATSQSLPEWLKPGAKYHILFSSTNISFSLSCYTSSTVLIEDLIDEVKNVNDIYTIPDGTEKIQICFKIDDETIVNEVIYPRIYLSYPAVAEGGQSAPSVVTVSGTTPTINGEAETRYICGQVSTLTINPPQSGIIDVLFTSGSSATILTLPSTVKLPEWFAVSENKIYEISIMDGIYGAVMVWDS